MAAGEPLSVERLKNLAELEDNAEARSLVELLRMDYEQEGRGWIEGAQWPPESVERSLYLEAGGGAHWEPIDGEREADVLRCDPDHPAPSPGGLLLDPREAGARDQRAFARRHDVLSYRSAPLSQALSIAGSPRLELFAGADVPDCDWYAQLADRAPDGSLRNICEGIQRSRWSGIDERDDEARWLEAGGSREIGIELHPTAWRFAPGHRLEVLVSATRFPRYDRNENGRSAQPQTAEQRICADGSRPSRMQLPVTQE